jgi:hypothetical protein
MSLVLAYNMHFRAHYDDGSEIDFSVECDSTETLKLASSLRATSLHTAGLMFVEPRVDEHAFHPLLWQSGNVFGYWLEDGSISEPYQTMFLADEALREHKLSMTKSVSNADYYGLAFVGLVVGLLGAAIAINLIDSPYWLLTGGLGYTIATIAFYALISWLNGTEI